MIFTTALRVSYAQETAAETNQVVTLHTLVEEALKKYPEVRVSRTYWNGVYMATNNPILGGERRHGRDRGGLERRERCAENQKVDF